MTDQL